MTRSARIANSNALRSDSFSNYTDSDSETLTSSPSKNGIPRTPRARKTRTPKTGQTPIPKSVSSEGKEETDGEAAAAITSATDISNGKMHFSSLGDGVANGEGRRSIDSETEYVKRSEEGRGSFEINGAADNGPMSPSEVKTLIGGALQSTIPEWAGLAVMISLIFGGCCSNVFALEAIVQDAPDSGHLITCAQFLLVSIEGFIHHFDWNSPTLLVKNQIPLTRWFGAVILFFIVSVLNNWAFDYNISVPIHIILRSGGSITTMLIGACMGKRFSKVQVASVAILTGGIILSAMSNAKSMGESEHSMPRFLSGLTILFVAQVLSALMGVYIEQTYQKYGTNWREGLFYTHALSMPLFIPFAQSIKLQFYRLYSSEPLPLPQLLPMLPDTLSNIVIPSKLFWLAVNVVTQYICVRGVNLLAGMSTALTVTIVLNIRKLVSLLLSITLFGNKLSLGVVYGATLVFLAAFVYGLESQRQGKLRREALARREQSRKEALAVAEPKEMTD